MVNRYVCVFNGKRQASKVGDYAVWIPSKGRYHNVTRNTMHSANAIEGNFKWAELTSNGALIKSGHGIECPVAGRHLMVNSFCCHKCALNNSDASLKDRNGYKFNTCSYYKLQRNEEVL